nr:type ISP restriction/modification enzyme [Nocardioides houyundeii]
MERGRQLEWASSSVRLAQYRPFARQYLYLDHVLNNRVASVPALFPTHKHRNVGFYSVGASSAHPFSVLMLDVIPDLHVTGAGSGGRFFPRWSWEPLAQEGTLDLGSKDGEVIDGYRRIDNIDDAALMKWRTAYGAEWTKDDVFFYVYGLLHSADYRERYAADLKKMLPRVPLVSTASDARAFADAGRALSELHIGYESVAPYPLVVSTGQAHVPLADVEPAGDPFAYFAVGTKKMRFGDKGKDRTVLHYNDRLTVGAIPAEAYRYQLGSRSALEWIIDRYVIKTDKASGILNDPNDWSREIGDPRYILDLLARVVQVSVLTMRIVDDLPKLTIGEA